MKPIYHVNLSSVGRRTLAGTDAALRRLVRALLRPRSGEVALFGAVDDHTHSVVQTDRPAIFARDQVRAIRAALPDVELQAPFIKPVESRGHLQRLAGYLLEQPERHGLATPPALWEGSCFLDLAGARVLSSFDPAVIARALPRLRLRHLLGSVGLAPAPIEPAADRVVHEAGPARVASLAASVYAVGGLGGKAHDVRDARALAVQTCLEVGFPLGTVVPYAGVSRRGARRAATRPVDPRARLALRRRLAIEEQVRASLGKVRPRSA